MQPLLAEDIELGKESCEGVEVEKIVEILSSSMAFQILSIFLDVSLRVRDEFQDFPNSNRLPLYWFVSHRNLLKGISTTNVENDGGLEAYLVSQCEAPKLG